MHVCFHSPVFGVDLRCAFTTFISLTGLCNAVRVALSPFFKRLPKGMSFDDIDIRQVITDLCVMDFNGPNRQMRVISLHPGVSIEEVCDNTAFDLAVSEQLTTTEAPTEAQLAIIAQLDPLNFRAKQLKDNPPGVRAAGAEA